MKTTVVKLEGTELLITESEKNIQINDIPEEKVGAVWECMLRDYAGYEIFFCFNSERMLAKQEIPIRFLDEVNAELIDDTLIFRLEVTDFTSEIESNLEIAPLTEVGFDGFATFHDHRNPDFFWTSKRIKARLDIWQIHTLNKKGQLTGYVMTMVGQRHSKQIAEIFTIESDDELEFTALLSRTCQTAFTAGKTEVVYMIEKSAPTNYRQIARDLGFKEAGFYQGFRVYL